MRTARVAIVTLLAMWSATSYCLAWGSGHDAMNRLAAELLPAPISEFLGEKGRAMLVAKAHAPDDFTPWTEYKAKRGVSLPAGDLAFLEAHGLKHPYALHSPIGQAATALLVARSMRDRMPERAGFWMACLLHTECDEAACNHDPLIHYMTYAYREGYGMTFPGKGFLDVGELCRTPAGTELVRQSVKQMHLGPLPPARFLVEAMMHGYRANAFMTARGTRIARAFRAGATPAEIADAHRALAELGAYGVAAALRMFEAAWKLAQSGSMPVLGADVMARFQREKRTYLAARPLSADSLFAELLPLASKKNGAVGVVVETSQRMNDGMLSWGGKLVSAAIMRTLHRQGVPFRLLDLRDLERACPPVEEIPMLIICTGRFACTPAVRNLKAFRARGGRLLLIGGEHRGCLGALSKALVEADPARLPVSLRYGCNNANVIGDIRVRFTGPFAERLGTQPYRFVHNPDTKAGWQKPVCAYRLADTLPAQVTPLAKLTVGHDSFAVAAMLRGSDGEAQALFVPEYLVAPYLLTDSPPLTDPSRPALDAVGSKVLAAAVGLLLPPH